MYGSREVWPLGVCLPPTGASACAGFRCSLWHMLAAIYGHVWCVLASLHFDIWVVSFEQLSSDVLPIAIAASSVHLSFNSACVPSATHREGW